jgi:hypothetical protein
MRRLSILLGDACRESDAILLPRKARSYAQMQVRLCIAVLLFATFTVGQQQKIEPDSASISGGVFESAFFKFHYEFPKGWTVEDHALQMEKNRKNHEDAVKKAKAKAQPDTPNSTTTTQVFWLYDLFLASPETVPPNGDRPPLPYVRVWATERFSMMDKPGDNARLLAQIGSMKVLRSPQEQKVSGRKFVRSDFISSNSDYVSMFDTLSGKYLLFFEFRGKNEQEMNELAKTMESVKFD